MKSKLGRLESFINSKLGISILLILFYVANYSLLTLVYGLQKF